MHWREVLAVGLTLVGMGCSTENQFDGNTHTEGAVGAQCSGKDDPVCGVAAVCALGYCRKGCTTDSQCKQGALCVGDTPPFGCQLPEDAECNDTDKRCKAPLVCGLDKTCRMPCTVSDDCPRNEHECHAGVCVGDGEKGAGAIAYRSCTDGARRCGPDGSFCFQGTCEIQECNVIAPGWATVSQCPADLPMCGAGECVSTVGAVVQVPSPLGGTYVLLPYTGHPDQPPFDRTGCPS